MTTESCSNEAVKRGGAAQLRVRDAMVASPKTTHADATVADLRALFANAHVRTALLVDGPQFVGVVDRETVSEVPGEQPARALARRDVATITSDAPLTEALAELDRQGERRLVVLDPEGRDLCGLLCLTRDRSGFCQG